MTKEEILSNREPGNDAGIYSDEQIHIAMDVFAKQQALAFHKFLFPTSPDFDAHISDRYDQFIEQQTKDK